MTVAGQGITDDAGNPPAGVFNLLAGDVGGASVAAVPAGTMKPENGGVGPVDATGAEIKPLLVRLLFDLARPSAGDRSELLKTRFLCRGGGALLVGQTGQGKSSLAMQAALSWAAGLPLFGIEPNGPLRVLLLQGENDDGDLAEARDGVAWAIEGATCFGDNGESERVAQFLRKNVAVVSENSLAGDSLLQSLASTLDVFHPDLLLIDPAFSYVSGDASNAADVGRFLRLGLNPLLAAHDCGALVIHHTAKPPGQKGAVDRSASAYAGHGSAEWANWARAVLTLEGLGCGRYKLHAAKRGGRLGWRDAKGETAFFRVLEHSTNEAGFCWQEVTGETVENPGKNDGKPGVAELVELLPLSDVISKGSLELKMRAAGFAEKWGRIVLNAAVDEGKVFLHKLPRSGKRAAVGVARFPSSEGEDDQP
jgi:hypothetical protein